MILKPSKKFVVYNNTKIASDLSLGFEYLKNIRAYVSENFDEKKLFDTQYLHLVDLTFNLEKAIKDVARDFRYYELRKIERLESEGLLEDLF